MWRLLKNLKMKLPDEPATPFPGMYPDKTIMWEDLCTPMYAAAVFSKQDVEKPGGPPMTG